MRNTIASNTRRFTALAVLVFVAACSGGRPGSAGSAVQERDAPDTTAAVDTTDAQALYEHFTQYQ